MRIVGGNAMLGAVAVFKLSDELASLHSGDRIHQGRGKAVVGFEVQLLQSRPDRGHLIGRSARLDNRRNKCCELGSRPALVL